MKLRAIIVGVVCLLISGIAATAGAGDGKDTDFFPRVDRVAYESATGQPSCVPCALGRWAWIARCASSRPAGGYVVPKRTVGR